MPDRQLVFVSHASETLDTEFSLWLSARLSALGYDVWCDHHELLGGEVVDADIQAAIERSAAFVYVLTDHSNMGDPQRYPIKELRFALDTARHDEVVNFVIPVQIAPLSGRAMIGLGGIAPSRDFLDEGWASGLRRLVRKLERDGVPRPLSDGAASVAAEWHLRYGSNATVTHAHEPVRSNWFPLGDFPKAIYVHTFQGDAPDSFGLPYPAVPNGRRLYSFATLDELGIPGSGPNQLSLGGDDFARGARTDTLLFSRFVEGKWKGSPSDRICRDTVVRLVRLAWNQSLSARGLNERALAGPAGERLVHWFPHGFAENNKVWFKDVAGKRRWRQLAGIDKDTKWHLGLGMFVRTWPVLALEVRPHIFFSDDGQTLWDDPKRSHKRSRRLRKSWRNAKWRALIHGAVGWAASEKATLELPLSPSRSVSVRSSSVTFESPVGYESPQRDRSVYVLSERVGTAEQLVPSIPQADERDDD